MTVTPVNKTQQELVRLLVLEHGSLLKASELSGVPYELVRQWESRRKRRALKAAGVTVSQNPTRIVANNVESELAENERETRLSLSRYAKRAAQDSEKLSVREAPYVKAVAQVAGITHKWNDQEWKASHFTLNVLNLNSLEVRQEAVEDSTQA